MDNIIVSHYQHPEKVGWEGWIEPTNGSWILFLPVNGKPVLFTKRISTGAVTI